MKSIVAPLIAAIVTALVGGAFWMMGQNDRRLGDVHAQLVTLRYAGAETQGGDVEEALGPERRVPMVGPTIVADVRDARATAGYWRGDYAAIGAQQGRQRRGHRNQPGDPAADRECRLSRQPVGDRPERAGAPPRRRREGVWRSAEGAGRGLCGGAAGV